MQMTEIITGVIAGIVAVLCQLLVNRQKKKEADTESALFRQEVRTELSDIKDRLDEHNGYAQKYAETHDDIIAIKKDIEYLKERLKP